MSLSRSGLKSLPIISAMLLMGCSNTHIVDTSPQLGNPRIVKSDVCVDVAPYADATSPAGGRVEKQCIVGQAVMSREHYAGLLTARKDNRLLGIYAEECTKDPLCATVAGHRADGLR